jgi:hypothetical protein
MKNFTIPKLLIELYVKSYFNNLNLKIDASIFKFDSFYQYLDSNNNSFDNAVIRNKIAFYKENNAIIEKIQPILNYSFAPKTYLDFGYGEGFISRFLCSFFSSIRTFYGVENTNKVIPLDINIERFFYNSLEFIKQEIQFVSAIHTLHHIDTINQKAILEKIFEIMSTEGILYLVEDSWRNNFKDNTYPNYCEQDIRNLLEINDYISNNWFYSNELTNDSSYYRSKEEWENLLSVIGFEIIESNFKQFNNKRLHGVPSISIIAKKPAANNI